MKPQMDADDSIAVIARPKAVAISHFFEERDSSPVLNTGSE